MKEKDRSLTMIEFLEKLQLEYVNAFVRYRIYPVFKDKQFQKKVMSYKKEKIDGISHRNKLDTIFNKQSLHHFYFDKMFVPREVPNFIYQNKNDVAEFRKRDILSYYNMGSSVKIFDEQGEYKLGIITDSDNLLAVFDKEPYIIDYNKLSISVSCRDNPEKSYEVNLSDVTRII